MKQIENFPDYFVTKEGKVFSSKSGSLRELTPWVDSTNRYLYVSLSKDGIKTNLSVHRLVALAFIMNPDNKPEVNHKNYNVKDNSVDNLEWVTRKENIDHSLLKNSPINNFIKCKIYLKNEILGEFDSKESAILFLVENHNLNYNTLKRYGKSGDFNIVPLTENFIYQETIHSQAKKTKLFKNNELIGEFNSLKEACDYASEKYDISSSSLKRNKIHKKLDVRIE